MRPLAVALILLLTVLAGCGDDGPAEEVSLGEDRVEPADPTFVAALGDSITAGTPFWDPDPAVREQFIAMPDARGQYGFWAQRRLRDTRFRNCGVNGERTDQILARFDGCTEGADVLILQGGINDIAQMRRVKTAARNLQEMVRRGKERGLRTAIVELIPWNNGYPGADIRIRRLNKLIAKLAADEGVKLIRWYDLLDDPERSGQMRADLTSDGNHPSVAGYKLLGEAIELP